MLTQKSFARIFYKNIWKEIIEIMNSTFSYVEIQTCEILMASVGKQEECSKTSFFLQRKIAPSSVSSEF